MIHVEIANRRQRGKRSRHLQCFHNLQFYVSGKMPMEEVLWFVNVGMIWCWNVSSWCREHPWSRGNAMGYWSPKIVCSPQCYLRKSYCLLEIFTIRHDRLWNQTMCHIANHLMAIAFVGYNCVLEKYHACHNQILLKIVVNMPGFADYHQMIRNRLG